MSFRGELREFELPDILQLIASQKKAGWLKIISRGVCHFVFFRDGKITSTKNPADEDDPLETYVSRRGLVPHEALDRVAALRRKTGMDVQDILEKEGLLDREEIQEIFEAMVEEDIFELMSVKVGQYEFETEDRPEPLPPGALSAEIGPILMEGARKADEIAEMRRALGPEEGVLVLTSAGRDRKEATHEENDLLSLVNGVRTIEEVIEDSVLDRYTATRLLFECAKKGWVGLLRTGATQRGLEVAPTGFDVRRAVKWVAPVVLLLLTSVLFSRTLQDHARDDALAAEWMNRTESIRDALAKEEVRCAIEAYRVKKGTYPQSLDALLEENLLETEAVRKGQRELWDYTLTGDAGDEFALAPAPPRPNPR
jgi:hypothetical protein